MDDGVRPLLRCRGVSKHFGALAAVKELSFDVAPGEVVSGYPARDHKSYLRAMARLMHLPELAKRVARLERGERRSSDAQEKGGERG